MDVSYIPNLFPDQLWMIKSSMYAWGGGSEGGRKLRVFVSILSIHCIEVLYAINLWCAVRSLNSDLNASTASTKWCTYIRLLLCIWAKNKGYINFIKVKNRIAAPFLNYCHLSPLYSSSLARKISLDFPSHLHNFIKYNDATKTWCPYNFSCLTLIFTLN